MVPVMWFATRMKRFAGWMMCLLLCTCSVFAGGNKGKPTYVSFHIETEGSDNPKMISPLEVMGKQRFFRRIPEVSSKDFVAFSPFPAEDQGSYGVIFQLKDNARRRFSAVTNANQGKWLVCQGFGRVLDGVLIDAPIDDGVIVVWKGFSLDEIKQLDETLPRFGKKKK